MEERSASIYSEEIQERRSAVNIKEFVSEQRDYRDLDVSDIDASAMEEEKGNEEPSRKRRLSYSGILEDVFLSKLAIDSNLPKEECEELVKKGKLIE